MKSAFVADVHGNLEAFRAVCSSICQEHVDIVVFLGDIVGYGANPNECIEELQQLTGHAVLGNHDNVAVGRQSPDGFNPIARAALEWTSSQLTKENKNFLRTLPLELEFSDMLAVHASPFIPDSWRYVVNVFDAEDAFAAFQRQVCFFGHSHKPGIFIELADTSVVSSASSQVALQPQCRYLINCGSVGQPRDGDPRACYGIFDSAAGMYRLERVAYDFLPTQKKILQAGLPPFLAERIAAGR